jgi:hypothetical protein
MWVGRRRERRAFSYPLGGVPEGSFSSHSCRRFVTVALVTEVP